MTGSNRREKARSSLSASTRTLSLTTPREPHRPAIEHNETPSSVAHPKPCPNRQSATIPPRINNTTRFDSQDLTRRPAEQPNTHTHARSPALPARRCVRRARDSIRGTEQKLNAEDASHRKTDRAYARIYVHLHRRNEQLFAGVGLAERSARCVLPEHRETGRREGPMSASNHIHTVNGW